MTRRAYSAAIVLIFATAAVHAAAQERARSAGEPWQIIGAFPKSEPGPLERRAKPVTPDNPIPRRTHFVKPQYPPEAAAVSARAGVSLRATIDELGRVGEVRALGVPVVGAVSPLGPTEERAFTAALQSLVRSASDAVRQWIYEAPADGPVAFDVTVTFSADGDPDVTVRGVVLQGADPESAPVAAAVRLLQTEPPAEGAVRVGSGIRPPTKVKHVAPIYPAAARQAKVSGVVILEARIEPDGRILEARVLRSIPELDDAALEAAKQWEFTPTLVNGVPIAVLMTITVQFSLQ